MDSESMSNEGSPSTHWVWKQVKIKQPASAQSDRPSEARPSQSLLTWPIKRPLNVTVKYRGGPECWWEIRSRGRVLRVHGATALHDALREFYGGSIPL